MLPKHGSLPNINSIFESLEERVLFDGVPDATFVLPQVDTTEPIPAQVQNLQEADYEGQRELILIDAGVENSEQLLAEILESRPDSALEIRMIDSGSDGVQQISAILAEAKGEYDGIHIISHGDEGEVQLGNTSLTADNLNRYADDLAGWADALTEDADLLFYGCELAGNAEGEAFIESISAITGADVAASDDLTGAADKGGDWVLEETVGVIETQSLEAKSWNGTLVDTDGDGISDVDEGVGTDTVRFRPDAIILNGADVSGTTDGTLAEGDEIRLTNVGVFEGQNLDILVSIDQVENLDSNGLIELDADPAGSPNIIVRDNVNLDPHIVFSVTFVEAGTSTAFMIDAPVSLLLSDIDSGDGQDISEVFGIETGTALSVDLGANLHEGGFVNEPSPPAGFTYFQVDPAINGDPNNFFDEINESSNPDTNISVNYSEFSTAQFVAGATGSHSGTSGRGFGLASFVVTVQTSQDTDADGIADHLDIDSDNDGILDADEAAELTAVQGDLGFFHNGDGNSDGSQTFGTVSFDPNTSPNVTDILDLSGETPNSNTGRAANTDSTVGAGLSEDPSTTGFEFDLLGADAPDLAAAIANDDFVEVTFSLASGISDVTITELFHTLSLEAGGGSNLGNYQLAAAISSDGFSTSDVLFDPYLIESTVPDGSNNNFQFTPQAPSEVIPVTLSGGTDYAIRFYVFDSGNADGAATFNDQFIRFSTESAGAGALPGDFDGDGIRNSLDIDSDNDGITDNVEAQTTQDYIAPSGIGGTAAFIDTNMDGLDDNFDAGVIAGGAHTGVGLTPVDTDSSLADADGIVDYLDTDSDNDGIDDAVEAGHGETLASIDASADTDGDGLQDVVEGGDVNDGYDVNDENLNAADSEFLLADTDDDTAADGSNAVPLFTDLDYRDEENIVPVVDLNGPPVIGVNHDDIFIEDDGVFLLARDAVVEDAEDNIIGINITPTIPGANDGADEFLILDEPGLQLSVNLETGVVIGGDSLTIGATTFAVTWNNGVIEVRSADPADPNLVSADLEDFLKRLGYLNINQDNTLGARVFEFEVFDRDFTASASTTITIDQVNDAPVGTVSTGGDGTVTLSGSTPRPIASYTTATEAEFSVADLLAQLDIFDAESEPIGIGIIAADESNGVWQYFRTDIPGFEWTDFQLNDPDNLDAEPVPDGEALLMDPDARLRFVANDGFTGEAGIEFRLWDGTVGTASNPPETTADDSGGTAPLDTSSLSSASFAALVGNDKDGDGVADSEDLDKDGDGILDSVESLADVSAGNSYTATDTGNDSTGTVATADGLGATFSTTAVDIAGFAGVQFNANSSGIELDHSSDPTVNGGPDRFVHDITVTPDAGSALNSVVVSQSTFTTIGNDEPHQLTLTWPGSTVATINDPDGQITSHADGDTITSGTVVTFADSISNATGSAFLFGADTWSISIDAGNIASAFTFGLASFAPDGVPLPGAVGPSGSGAGESNDTGERFREWISFSVNLSEFVDTDGDGIGDHCDLDSDNDGISDLVESGNAVAIAADTDGDGMISAAEATAAGLVDADGDGVLDTLGTTPVDTDGDGIADYLDLDSDNDGIPDAVEAQPTAGYTAPDGSPLNIPVDTDGDGVADYLDTDSDGDGASDTAESGLVLSGDDLDGDGIDDAVNASFADPDGDVNDPINDLTNADTDAAEADYRSVNDKDGDGVADFIDLDDDNDGILDTDEGFLEVTQVTNPVFTITSDVRTTDTPGLIIGTVEGTFVFGTGGTGTFTLDYNQSNVGTTSRNVAFSIAPGASGGLEVDTTGNNGTAGGHNLIADFQSTITDVGTAVGFAPTLVGDGGSRINSAYQSYSVTFPSTAPGVVNDPANQLDVADGSDYFSGTVFNQPNIIRNNELQWSIVGAQSDSPEFSLTAEVGSAGEAFRFDIEIETLEVFTVDTDGDGIADHCDLDSDNDGISDLVESGADASVVDVDGDGFYDGAVDPVTGIPLAANGGAGVVPVDSDMDGIADFRDLDSDADGIADAIEAQPTVGYQTPSIGSDSDSDGVVDTFDSTTGHGGDFNTPEDTDGDGIADYLDTNSDNDDLLDSAESGLTLSGDDLNGDGIDDAVAPNSYLDTDGIIATPIDDLENIDSDAADVDYRSINLEAMDDVYVGTEETPLPLDPLANDDSGVGIVSMEIQNVPDAATEGSLTYVDDITGVTITVAPGAVLSPTAAATLVFTPVMDFSGPVPTIGYTVTDEEGQVAGAVIDITITGTPDAVDDPFTTNEDTPVNVSPLGNDDDGAGVQSVTVDTVPPATEGVLTYTDASGAEIPVTPGTVLTAAEAATLTFTPEEDFNGTVTPIGYTLTDINGATSEADILIDITPTPDAEDDIFTTPEDTPVLLDPLANDDLADGADSVTVNNVPDPSVEGILTYLDATGNPVTVMAGDVLTPEQAATLTFVPLEDFNGTVPPINYTVTDINGETSDADILFDVTPTPDAVDDPFTTNEDTPVNVSPLGNDDDGAGVDSVTVNTIPDPAEGILTCLDASGAPGTVMPGDVLTAAQAATLEFTPEEDFNGPITPIEYTLTDINGATSDAEITVDVTPTPDAEDDALVTNEDTPVAVDPLANDDVGAGASTVTINNVPDPALEGAYTYIDDATGLPVTVAAGAMLSPTEAASLLFTPVEDFNGVVTTVAYTVTDVNGETSDANIDITITPTPDAVDDDYTGIEDMPVALDPLSNDDLGAGAASVEILNIPDPALEGTLTYVDDLTGATITVAPGAILTPAEAASLMFNPVADFNGPVTPIGYEVTDVNGATSEAVIDITITPTPDAVDDPFTTNEDTPVNVSPLGNDDDGAGVASVTVDTIPDPAEGILTYLDASGNPVTVMPGDVLTPAQAATLEFVPEEDFNGPITPIEYTLTDINGAESSAEITVDVTPTPDAMDDVLSTPEDTPVLLDPLANDDLADGADSVTVNNVPDPAVEGILTYLDATGNPVTVMAGDVLTPEQAATLTFVPLDDFNGTVPPINYTVTDINGEASDADILIDVIPTPDAVDDPFTTNEDTPVNVSPLGNDDDGAGVDSVTVNTIPDPAEGVLTYLDASGAPVTVMPGTVLTAAQAATLEFTPEEDFNGPITPIEYALTDINGATSDAEITVDVTPTPDAEDDALVTNEDTPVAVDPLANDDVGAGASTVTINNVPDPALEGEYTYIDDATGLPVMVAAGAVLSPTEAASLLFTPVEDFNGVVTTVAYTVTDVNGETSDANIDITITPTPDAVDDEYTGIEDMPVALDPLSNDDLGAGADSVEILNVPDAATEGTLTYIDDLTGAEIPVAPGAVLTPAEAASLAFNPVADFNGPVTPIGYEVTDVNGETSEAMIDITITPTPDAVDDPFTTNEDTPVNVSPLGNDDDGAGVASVTVDTIPDPAEGILTYLDASGNPVTVMPGDVLTPAQAATLEFVPEEDFNGPVTPIEYTLTDINGAESSAEITVDVIPTPDAEDDIFMTNEDTPVLLSPLANDDLADGAVSLTVNNIPDSALEGTLTYLDAAGNPVTVMAGDVLTPEQAATLTFVPLEDFNGTVPPIGYTVEDINGETSDAEILLTVTPTPDAEDDVLVTNEDTPVALDPLANDDLGAGAQSVTVSNVPDGATEGTLTYTDAAGNEVTVAPGDVLTPAEAATLMFNPAADFSGTVPPIGYTAEDINGETSDAEILLTVTPTPDAEDDALVTNEDTPVAVNPLANDDVGAGADFVTINNVPDGATEGEFTYTDDMGVVQTLAAGDVLSPTEAASMEFTPVADFSGMVATVAYTVTDINGETSDANIDITVTPTPDAMDDTFGGNEDTPVALDPLGNDDLGAGADTVEILNIPDPATEGALTYIDELTGNALPVVAGTILSPAEAASLMFIPVEDFNGPVSPIGYEVTDVNGETSQAVIDIDIIATPDAVDDVIVVNEDTPVLLNPLANDDVGPGAQSVTVNNVPDGATEGTLTYTDAAGNEVTVAPGAVLTPEEAATLTFNPAPDFSGTVPPIGYTVEDINGETSDAEILLTVTPTPDAVDDVIVVNEDTPVLLDPLANDDLGAGAQFVTVNNVPDGATEGTLTYTDAAGNEVTVAPGTVLTPEEAATLTFVPVEDFNGTVPPINYTVTDVNGEMSDAAINITVVPTPDAVDDVNATSANTPVSGNVIDNDTSFAGENLMVTEVNGIPIGNGPIETDCGTVEISADGTYTFTPLPGLAGVDTFTYTVVDENGVESEATVVIDIADLGLAKTVAETPTQLADGTFSVPYQLVVQNNGSLDIGDLSLVEDLASQFGDGFVSAGNLRLTSPAGDVGSSIAIDSSFNGDSISELVAAGSTLAAGDSFTLEFNVIVDASEFDSATTPANTVTGAGTALDANGDPIADANGNPVLVSDLSDSGTDPSGDNVGEPGDTFGSDDPTPLLIPSIGLAKSAGDAVANGDNFDVTFTLVYENTGTVDLSNLTLVDDIASEFGNAFVSTSGVAVQNFVGSGVPPTVSNVWAGDTAESIIVGGTANVGDTFEVVFTITIDPDADGISMILDNRAVAGGEALDSNGDRLLDANGVPVTASDASDNGSDPNSENGLEGTTDGVFSNDPTPIQIADLGIAKSVVGDPVLTELGNFVVTFQAVVENTGTVDLADLSLLEDLSSQFGTAFVDAGNLVLVASPTDSGSNIAVDSAGFNGVSVVEILDATAGNVLAVGDSFTVTFDVEIDPREVSAPLENQVEGSGSAVDANGNPILDSTGTAIVGSDVSDSGTDSGSTNSGAPNDLGTSDDPTLFDPPAVPLGLISGAVFQDDNNDGFQQFGEIGIAGVTVTLTGTDVFGNAVEITTTSDPSGRYTFEGLNAGEYVVTQTQPEGFTDGIDIDADGQVAAANDVSSNISLSFGEAIESVTFAERLSGTSGNPPRLPALAGVNSTSLGNLVGGFTSSPGTIYSGVPINGNSDPLALDSGRPVTGGYALSQADQLAGDDGCEVDACGNVIPIEQIIDDGCGCGPVSPQGQMQYEDASIEAVEVIPVDADSVSEDITLEGEVTEGDVVDQIDQRRAEEMAANSDTVRKPSFLKRIFNWLDV